MISNGTASTATISISSTVPKYVFNECAGLKPKKVIFNGPATVVYWNDGTKTVVKCKDGTEFDKWTGLAMATSKRIYGDKFKSIFRKWCTDEVDLDKSMFGDAVKAFLQEWNKVNGSK